MNFWQWVYDLLAVAMLQFYLSALLGLLEKPSNVRKMSLGCSIYIIDTVIGMFYTLYFVYFWFSRSESSPATSTASSTLGSAAALLKRATVDLSQSASASREVFLTASGTIITTAIRVYFCVVILSFTKLLLIQAIQNKKSYRTESISEDAEYSSTVLGKVKVFVFRLEVRSKEYLEEHLIGHH